MGVFIKTRAVEPSVALRNIIQDAVETDPTKVNVDAVTNEKAAQAASALTPKDRFAGIGLKEVAVAVVILLIFAGAGLWAESAGLKDATENLWKAFQTALGIFLGWISGEAVATATNK